ncbi:MAG: glycosyltransferase [Niameybacter sp.]
MTEWLKEVFQYIDLFFVLYLLGYSTFLLLSVTVGATALYEQQKKKKLYNFIDKDHYIPVSIVVPAYNEQITVIDTVKSLLELDYTLYEVIVVDDGSTDDMREQLIEHFQMERVYRPIRKKILCEEEHAMYMTYAHKIPITLICKKNGGKADALNMGINVAKYPYFVCMDADSVLQADALRNLVRPILEEKNVIACGGLIRILNNVVLEKGKVINYGLPKNKLVGMQIIEYDRTFLASRLLFDKFNGNLIISGAFGLFKKDLAIAVGGYDKQTVGEDMELVVRLHAFCKANQIPYQIKYATDAICWSQAPNTLKNLVKQRRRWHRGLLQSIWAHKHIFFNVRYGGVGLVSLLYFLIYELLAPYIELLGIGSMIIAIHFRLFNASFMIYFLLMYMVFGMVMSLTAFISSIYAIHKPLKAGEILKAIGLCILESSLLRSILFWVRLTAFVGYKKKRLEWDAITRHEITRHESHKPYVEEM